MLVRYVRSGSVGRPERWAGGGGALGVENFEELCSQIRFQCVEFTQRAREMRKGQAGKGKEFCCPKGVNHRVARIESVQ